MTEEYDVPLDTPPPGPPIPEGEVAVAQPIEMNTIPMASVADNLTVSVDSQLGDSFTSPTTSPSYTLTQEAIPRMALAMVSASNGAITLEDAQKSLSMSDDPSKIIEEFARGLRAEEQAQLKRDFRVHAASGNVNYAQLYAEAYARGEKRSQHIDTARSVAIITQKALENEATSKEAIRENNKPIDMEKLFREKGARVASSELISSLVVDKFGTTPSGKEALLHVGATLATVGTAIFASNPVVATVAGVALTATELVDNNIIREAIKKHAGISTPDDTVGIADTIDMLWKYLDMMPPEQAQKVITPIVKEILDKADYLPSAVGKLQAIYAVQRLLTGVDDQPGILDMSLRSQDLLTGVGVVGDAIGAYKVIKNAVTPAKVLADTVGGSEVGRIVVDDVLTGKNSAGVEPTMQFDLSLSANLNQYLPSGVTGTSGTVQKGLKDSLMDLLDALDERMLTDKDVTLQQTRAFLTRYIEHSENSIRSWNPQTGDLLLQHPETAAPWISKENAQRYAALLEKETGLKFDVIPSNQTIKRASGDSQYAATESSDALKNMWMEVEAFGENANVGMVLNTLKRVTKEGGITGAYSSSTGKVTEEVARLFGKGGLDSKTPVRIMDDTFELARKSLPKTASAAKVERRVEEIQGLAGYYSIFENAVYINPRYTDSPSLLLHEISHSRVAGIVDVVLSKDASLIKAANITNEQKQAVWNLDTLMMDAVKQTNTKLVRGMPNDEVYGLKDVHEFFAESTTNPVFQETLKGLTVSEEALDSLGLGKGFKGGIRTVWDAFVRTMGKLLGYAPEQDSILAHALEEAAKLSNSVTKGQTDMVGTLRKAGVSESRLGKVFEDVNASMDTTSLSDGWLVSRAGVGLQKHTDADIASRIALGDPKHLASEEAMHGRFISLGLEAKDRSAFTKFVKDNIAVLSRKEHARVKKVLMEGDATGREFNLVELEGRNLKSDKEIKAYYAYRTVENITLALKNRQLAEALTAEGWFQGVVKYGSADIGTPAKYIDAASLKGQRAFDLRTNDWVTITPEHGKVFKTRHPVVLGGTDHATMFVGDSTTLRMTAWRPQIPTLPGSYRRIYNQDYFGRMKVTKIVDGVSTEQVTHLRTSNSGKDIEAWAKGMNDILATHLNNPGSVTQKLVETKVGLYENPEEIMRQLAAGEWDNIVKDSFNHHYNRTSEDYMQSVAGVVSDAKDMQIQGRGRKLETIDKDASSNIDSPMEALEKEITNISRMRSQHEWRDKWVGVWWNTFGNKLDASFVAGRRPLEVMADPRLEGKFYIGGEDAVKFAESQRKYIMEQIGQQTLDERLYTAAMKRITYGIGNKTYQAFGKEINIGNWMRNADPVGFLRALNFNTMLGMFNPAQLIVQSQQLINITAISPMHSAKAIPSVFGLRVALMSNNPAVWSKVAMGVGVDAAEFATTIKMLRRSGLLDGVASTSLYNTEAGAFNMFNGWAKTGLQKGAFVFNRTEEYVRLSAFEIARREFRASYPNSKWDTNEALTQILSRTDDLTQNMTRANQAFYQRGVMAIPAQFLQYNLKLTSNLMSSFVQRGSGRGFTRGESARLMGAHLLAYGLAGNGLMSIYDEVVGADASDDTKLALTQGGLSWLANEMSKGVVGEEMRLGLGERLGTFNYYESVIKTALKGDASFWKVALGPSASLIPKLGAFRHLATPYTVGDLSPEMIATSVHEVLKTMMSSWSNGSKAIYAYNNDKRGVSKAGVITSNMTTMEIVAQALGIPPAEEKDYYRFLQNKADFDSSIKDFAKAYHELDIIRLDVLDAAGGVETERYNKLIVALASIEAGLPVGAEADFYNEREKLMQMRTSEDGTPVLVQKHLDILEKYITSPVKDSPMTKSYGVR